VGSTSINLACKYARLNDSDASAIVKPNWKIYHISEIKEKEFELFFKTKVI